MPFFLAAHAYASHSATYRADGYSRPYQYAICLAALFWSTIGLFFLGRFLISLAGDDVAALTVLIIGGATNLFCYTVANFGFAHAYLFMLFSMLLYYMARWHDSGRHRYIYCLAVILGLITITRPTDVLIVLIPLFWKSWPTQERRNKIRLVLRARKHLLSGLVCFLLVLSPLIAYWKWVTGHYIFYTYEGEWFDFLHPRIIKGLFSYRKGWFVYTPVAFIAMFGIIALYVRDKGMAILVSAYLAIAIYIVFSWHQWFYGWGFGCRPLIESLPVVAIPLAALIQLMLRRAGWVRIVAALVFGFCIWLNIYQTNQYLTGALPGDRISKAYYWRVWNRLHNDVEDNKLLQ